jgi:uncharacterized membrane protein YbaN (DUF454 family)
VNRQEAKTILALYRPGSAEADDPEFKEAMQLAERDPELRHWFEQHRAFQEAMREKFRRLDVPADLKRSILAKNKIIAPHVWWRHPAWLAAAAAIVVLMGLSAFWRESRRGDQFADYRARMVRTALRQYRMDIVTNDLNQIRQFLSTNGAPADYVLAKGLKPLAATGAGLLRWGNSPVSMLCFDRGDQQMLFLFVVNRAAVKGAPPAAPQLLKVYDLQTVSWSQGSNAYILAGPEDPQMLQKYW